MNNTKEIGQLGENVAASFLQKAGYNILFQNWRKGPLEIDIIATDGPILVIVEVKLRSNQQYGDPESFVRKPKHSRLFRAADIFVEEKEWKGEVRFDIIAITQMEHTLKIDHFPDAFYPGL